MLKLVLLLATVSWAHGAFNLEGSCGRSGILQRIIFGDDAAPGAWPWQIGLLDFDYNFFCGGTLIHKQWVVTAAHCIDKTLRPSKYTILLGAHDRNNPMGHEQRIKAARIFIHPQYGRPELNNDIALIKLAEPATLTRLVTPACLPSHDYQLPLSSTCYITGGRRLTITEEMLCAGVENTFLSGCHGDSGGPYVCRDASNRFVLHGVVSWGSPMCNALERYTVFARVAKFRTWIDKHMKRYT